MCVNNCTQGPTLSQSDLQTDRQARKEVREKEGGGEGERGAGAEGGTEGLWLREYITELPPELAAAGTEASDEHCDIPAKPTGGLARLQPVGPTRACSLA